MKNSLTEIEKIAIEYLAITGAKCWRTCYYMSHDKNSDPGEIHPATISKWKNSKIVQDYFNTVRYRHNERIQAEIENGIKQERTKKEGTQQETGNKNVTSQTVDFTNRNEFIKYLNSAVNSLQDDKQKTDYLKMLSDLLRFKETETGKDNEIQRFYTPITCNKCPIYRDQQGK